MLDICLVIIYLFVGARCPWLLLGKLILTNTNLILDLSKSDVSAFFFSRPVTPLLKASISVHLPVISRSGLSEVINELC